MKVAGVPDFLIKIYPSWVLFVPSSIEAIKSETSGFPVSALVASIAILVTDANVALFNRISPVPGSAIEVELSKVYFHATAATALVALVALVAAEVALVDAAVAEVPAAVAEVADAVAEVADAVAEVAEAVAEVADAVAEVAAAVAEVAAAVAEVAAAVAEVAAAAASISKSHFATSVFDEIGCAPEDVCPVLQMYILLFEVSLTMSLSE